MGVLEFVFIARALLHLTRTQLPRGSPKQEWDQRSQTTDLVNRGFGIGNCSTV